MNTSTAATRHGWWPVRLNLVTPMHIVRQSTRLLLASLGVSILSLLSGCEDANTDGTAVPIVPPPPAPSAPQGIQPGEKLDVFVMEDDSFSGSYSVRSTGHVIMPKLGRIKVGGLSASGAESAIKDALERDKLTQATVLVDRPDIGSSRLPEVGGVEVFLSGKVARPGRYRIVGVGGAQPTVHQAILQAGGCGRFAHRTQVHILRRKADGTLARINADLEAIEAGQTRDVPLATGDIIMVPEKMIDFGI